MDSPTDKIKSGLPGFLKPLIDDLVVGLGDRLVGVLLYGSWANNSANEESDVDLAVIIADADADRSRSEVFRIFYQAVEKPEQISLSVETFLRMRHFLEAGDPFAWTVCLEGQVLIERNTFLTDLKEKHINSDGLLDREKTVTYLRQKSTIHYQQSMHAFHSFLSNLQLSIMAGAQAVAVENVTDTNSGQKLVPLSSWEVLHDVLKQIGVSNDELSAMRTLVYGHKEFRLKSGSSEISNILNLVAIVGKTWERLSTQSSKTADNNNEESDPIGLSTHPVRK